MGSQRSSRGLKLDSTAAVAHGPKPTLEHCQISKFVFTEAAIEKSARRKALMTKVRTMQTLIEIELWLHLGDYKFFGKNNPLCSVSRGEKSA